ncbi:helix-turn-helix transcriptional regulator [Shewanella sp. Scap07]|uniref:helix-turn-helix domain-containing protein n=1 Tax=Shewanella sp. Scap07 TaxID=2589987 RepID=UPI0015BDD3D3|nr:AraC family transcriptional regulator [Shewanella sp. Scap07]QLE84800.1 helix-turn-helix transcriptional regulator [Shewanella sp. Scap07]
MPNKTVVPLFKSEYTVVLVELLKQLDKDIYPIIDQAKLPENILQQDHDYVPEASVINLLDILMDKVGPEKYSQFIAAAAENIYIPRYLARMTDVSTLEGALKQFIELVHIESTHTHLQLKLLQNKMWFVRQRRAHAGQARSVLAEQFALTFMLTLMRTLLGKSWQPIDVSLCENQAQTIQNALGLNASQFYTARAVTAISFDPSMLATKVHVRQNGQVIIEEVRAPEDFVESLINALTPYFMLGRLPIAQAAVIVDMSVRTLQRRLTKAGVSYSQVVDRIIFLQAKKQLAEAKYSVTDISANFGYADVAHFSRAFKRYVGMSPRAYQQQLANP